MRTMRTQSALFLAGLCIGFVLPSFSAYAQFVQFDIPEYEGRPPDEHPILAPCSRNDERYAQLGFADLYIEELPDEYHGRVDRVLEEYLEPLDLTCDAENYAELMKPGEELESLANALPTWASGDVELSRFDTARVLLEYLRVYECALTEFEGFLLFDTALEEFDINGPEYVYHLGGLVKDGFKRIELIRHEQLVARRALHRALTMIGAFERLRPIEAELECMQRVSLDMRNIAALTAETSACLPRAWNAKDTLRDMEPSEE